LRYALLPAALLLLSQACSRTPAPPANPRLALVRLDNQATNADHWVAPLFSLLAQHYLRDAASLAPTLVDDSQGWRSAGVGRYVSGDYRRTPQGLRLSLRLTDANTSRVLAESSLAAATDQDLPGVASRLLSQLLSLQPAPLEGSPADWLAFAQALASRDLTALQSLSPPPAVYPSLARLLLSLGQRDAALALPARLPASASPLTRAELGVVLAASPADRLTALQALAPFRPADPLLLADLATLAFNQRQWALAATHFATLTRLDPQRPDWFNQLGYAHARQGQLPQAVAALEQYRRLAPNDPNALDSLAEVHYLNRRFPEAARYFDQVPANFQHGVSLRKAAFAYANAKDLPTADKRFEQWLQPRASQLPPSSLALTRALWQARTHRFPAALDTLAREAASSSGERQTLAQLHAAALRFGQSRTTPNPADLKRWAQALTSPAARNELGLFALLAQPPATLPQRITAALPRPEMQPLRQQLLAAAQALQAPPPDLSRGEFPLPPDDDNLLAALLLTQRPAVLQ
jgi:Flp pilus assembly protein TadD